MRQDEHLLARVLHAVADLVVRAGLVACAGAPVERRVLLRGRNRVGGTLCFLAYWPRSAVGRLCVRILNDACLLLDLPDEALSFLAGDFDGDLPDADFKGDLALTLASALRAACSLLRVAMAGVLSEPADFPFDLFIDLGVLGDLAVERPAFGESLRAPFKGSLCSGFSGIAASSESSLSADLVRIVFGFGERQQRASLSGELSTAASLSSSLVCGSVTRASCRHRCRLQKA